MARLLILLLGRRWALIACGVALVIAGLIWGAAGSHQVSYENSLQNGSYHIGNGSQSAEVLTHQLLRVTSIIPMGLVLLLAQIQPVSAWM
jgi:hypothetical protein